MQIELPDDLNSRLKHLAEKGQDVDTLVREAIETRLAMEEQIERNLEGWTDEELRAEIQGGLDDLASGNYTDHDETSLHEFFEDIKARGRKHLEAQKQHPN